MKFFIEIGSADFDTLIPLAEKGWSGVFIEPVETLAQNLIQKIKEKKLKELPQNLVIFATTSQIVNSIGEGLRGIKKKNTGQIPTNITTIKNFEPKEGVKDFMSYGSSAKNLYLLLLEDL